MKRFLLKTLCILPALPALSLAAEPSQRPDLALLRKEAQAIDAHIANSLRRRQLAAPKDADDATFLRRSFLVATGRIPTFEESRAFLEINDPDKRAMLVGYLLNSPGHASHMSNWAFDLLRLTDGRVDTSATNEPYREWVREAMDQNMPWDQFTNALLASSGDGWDPQSAAVGYYTRDRGMPLDNISNTMRIFLGKRMECAQCHDDPFGTTERMDFYQLAAFTHGQEPIRRNHMAPLWRELEQGREAQGESYRLARVLWERVYGMSLQDGGEGRIQLPSDYQYRDARPGDWVGGRTPFGRTVRSSDKKSANDGRKQLADWVTRRAGDPFPAVIANRLWQRVMGTGIYEPVDEYRSPDKTHAAELLRHLSELMVRLQYDMRAFQHTLMLTRTFGFETNPEPSKIHGADDFHGRKIKRLTAEQVWDSLITLANGNPDLQPRRTADPRILVDGRPVLVGKKTMSELSREVLALESESQVREYFQRLLNEVRSGSSSSSNAPAMSMMAANRPLHRPGASDLVRASELPSPAPRGHLLYLFGQSDREVVEAASLEPNVSQVLSLLNGFVQKRLVNSPDAHLYKSLEGAANDTDRVRQLCIAILSRPPDETELPWMLQEIRDRGEEGYRNLVSALILSSEFLFLP
jgi:hypothetical protein